jgi:hypothetical protein
MLDVALRSPGGLFEFQFWRGIGENWGADCTIIISILIFRMPVDPLWLSLGENEFYGFRGNPRKPADFPG